MFDKILNDFKEVDLDEMRFEGFLEKRANEIKKCVENVKNGSGWYDIKTCPICNSEKREIFLNRFDRPLSWRLNRPAKRRPTPPVCRSLGARQ